MCPDFFTLPAFLQGSSDFNSLESPAVTTERLVNASYG